MATDARIDAIVKVLRSYIPEEEAEMFAQSSLAAADAVDPIRASHARLLDALDFVKQAIIGHYDDDCEDCRNALGIINAAIAASGGGGDEHCRNLSSDRP